MIDFERTIALSLTDQKTPTQKALKTAEETGELAQAVLSYYEAPCCGYKGKKKEEIIIEAVDVIQCALSVISKSYEKEGFPKKDFERIYNLKLNKWEEKQKDDKQKNESGFHFEELEDK